MGKLPIRSCGSVPHSVRPVTDLSPRAGMGSLPELGFSGIRCSLRPHPLIFLGNHSSLQCWFKWGRLAKVLDTTPTAALAALLTPHHGLHFVFQRGDFVNNFSSFTSLVSETGFHSRLQLLVRLLELILNAGLDVDLETFYSVVSFILVIQQLKFIDISTSIFSNFSVDGHMQTRHVKIRRFWSGTRTCSFLAFCSNFRKALSQTMLHGFMISRTHVLAATIVQHGRGRDHGHIQCCFLPSLEFGQIWQSVVQPFRLRLNVCRIQRSPS